MADVSRELSEQPPIPSPDQGDVEALRARLAELEANLRLREGDAIARAHLAAIVESSDDAIISKSLDGVIRTWNQGAERILGYLAQDVVGRHISILIPDDRRDEEAHILAQVRAGKRIEHYETVRLTKDKRPLDVSLTISPILDLGGRIVGASKIMRDITGQKEFERELQRAREAAEAGNKAKEQFLAVLSHELRTPLTPALATITHMEELADLPPKLRADVSMIRRNVEMEARLIDDLLDITRIQRGKVQLHFEAVDGNEAMESCLDLHRHEIRGKRQTLVLELSAQEPHIWADAARLQQVLDNLISNAVKFTPAGGRIELRTSNESDNTLVFQVSDSGMGIEPEAMGRIFDAFEQGEASRNRQFGGLGLGLAIAKSLADLHQGVLSAKSAGKDQGTTFMLRLSTVPARPADPAAATAAESRSSKRILLVEDHKDTLLMLTRLLKSFGYMVSTASSVREAMELMNREKFDILLSDIGLPDGSGLELARHAKARRAAKTAIALSGYGLDEDLRRSREAGFEMHITKPINFQTLQSILSKATAEIGEN